MELDKRPTDIFDREFEWSALAGFCTSGSAEVRLGVVSGRRRQGKTYLLQALSQAVGGFYFTATEATAADSLREFGAALAEHTDAGAPYLLADWADAIRVMFEVIPDGLAVIDEFPHLIRSSPELPSVLQRALDPQGAAHRGSSARLLLCGSAMSVMGGLLGGHAPLRGRAGLELIVNPFDYRTAAAFYESIMRSRWTLLEQRQTQAAWRDAKQRFLAQVVGPHVEELCRQWARSYGQDAFGGLPAEVAAAVVDDPASRARIQIDVAVLAPVESDAARRVLSLGCGEPGTCSSLRDMPPRMLC